MRETIELSILRFCANKGLIIENEALGYFHVSPTEIRESMHKHGYTQCPVCGFWVEEEEIRKDFRGAELCSTCYQNRGMEKKEKIAA